MPELPEVETVRAGLQRWVAGRTVADVEVRHPRAVRRHLAGADDFAARLRGQRLQSARRRGKYLWLPLDSPSDALTDGPPGGSLDGARADGATDALIAHLGMSGQLLVQPPDAPAERHLHVRVRFTDGGRELRFVDQRTFGGLLIDPLVPALDVAGDTVPAQVAHIARDPMDPAFDDALFARRLRARRTGVKRALLDQTLVSGIGNIYADESLWRARLNGERPTAALTGPRIRGLLTEVRAVLGEALAAGGTSFDSLYVNVNGESGYFDRTLNVYGREGQACRRCGTPIRRTSFMNRSSFFCPRCQPIPRGPRSISERAL